MKNKLNNKRRAVFLDRDGVINVDHGYVSTWERFEFIAGVPESLAQLQKAGYVLVVVSNQSGVGRGLYTESDVVNLHDSMCRALEILGVTISGIYYCPHHPTKALKPYRVACDCRKPAPGLILNACMDLNLDPSKSILVGDKKSDIEAGRAAGVGELFWVSAPPLVNSQNKAHSVLSLSDVPKILGLSER